MTGDNCDEAISCPSVDDELSHVLETCLADLEAGRTIDVDRILAAYPHTADRLRECLASLQFVQCSAKDLSSTDDFGSGSAISSDALGQLGDFRIVRQIGRGGMGIVYEALQVSLQRRVALKVLPFAAVFDEKHRKRFQNEALAAAALEHPHIVPVYSVGSERGVHFYAMRFVDGIRPAEVIARMRSAGDACGTAFDGHKFNQGPTACSIESSAGHHGQASALDHSALRAPHSALDTIPIAALSTDHATSPREFFRFVARVGIQAAHALHHAHQLGLVHRDIKPSNLMIEWNGHVWVTDFGLARLPGDSNLTLSGDLVGTLRYMSPEQAMGDRPVDHRCDVYGLGVTLYELATLQPPFADPNRQKLLQQVIEQTATAPSKINRSVPADLETVILKAIAKDPADRYATAEELADDLERFVQNKPIRARRSTRIQRAWRWCRRNPGVAILSASVLLLLCTLSIVGPTLAIKEARAARESRRLLYVSDMGSAFQSWEDGNLDRLEMLLARHIPRGRQEDWRAFESHYLNAQLQNVLQTPTLRHPDQVTDVEFLDATILVTACADGYVRLWDVGSHRYTLRATYGPHAPGFTCIAVSPDGRTLAAGSSDGTATFWDLRNGHRIRQGGDATPPDERVHGDHGTAAANAILSITYSPDGSIVAVARANGSAEMWASASGELLAELGPHADAVNAVAFAPHGQSLATVSSDRTIRLWHDPQANCNGSYLIPTRWSPRRLVLMVGCSRPEDETTRSGYGIRVPGHQSGRFER